LPAERVAGEGVDPAPMIVALADSQQPGAYRADRVPDVMGPQTHYGYAAQWFALAAALTILTVVASYKKNSKPSRANQRKH
jgi:cytochrome oxidase assembly protein ShyY1